MLRTSSHNTLAALTVTLKFATTESELSRAMARSCSAWFIRREGEASRIRILSRLLLLAVAGGFILLAAWPGWGQEKSTRNTDTLRNAVKQLEIMKVEDKPDSIQLIHKRTLLSVYGRLEKSLQDDIIVLEQMKSAADNTAADTLREITGQIQKLVDEHNATIDKIKELRGNLQASLAVLTPPVKAATASGAIESQITTAAFARNPSALTSAEVTHRSTATAPGAASRIQAPDSAPTPDPNKITSNKITLCGQVTLASLNQTLALIKSTPAFKRLAERFRPNGVLIEDLPPLKDRDPLITSSLDDQCVQNNLIPSRQKNAVVDALKEMLEGLESSDRNSNSAGYERVKGSSLSRDTIRKQIVLLDEYVGNLKVHIWDKDGKTVLRTPLLDKDGNYFITFEPDGDPVKGAYTYYISTEGDNDQSKREIRVEKGKPMRVNLFVEDRPVSLLTRAVVGYEQAGAAAAKKKQDYFFDFFISKTLPIAQKVNPDFGERLRTWGDIRIASIPQSGTATVGELTTGLVSNISGLPVKDVAQVFDFQAGLEFRLTGNDALLPSFDRKTKQKFSLSLIAGFGAITPTEPQESISVFKVFNDAPGLPAAAKGKEFVAFIDSDRDRFFRQYYAGVRLQTFFFNRFNMPMQRFPAQLDIAIGQNEFMSGGSLHGPVFRLDGYFPLPYNELQFINIYGTALMRTGRAQTSVPLILQPAPTGTTVPAANVALVPVRQIERDYYRAGIGIDFISFVKKLREGLSKSK